MSARTSINVSLTAQLSQDSLPAQQSTLAASGVVGIFPVPTGGFVLATQQAEARLSYYYRDDSVTGWREEPIELPVATRSYGPLVSVVPFVVQGEHELKPTQTLNLLCKFAVTGGYAIAWVVRSARLGWREANLTTAARSFLSQVDSIDAVDGGPNIALQVYGVTSQFSGSIPSKTNNSVFFLLHLSDYRFTETSHWDVIFQTELHDLGFAAEARPELRLLAKDSGGRTDLAFVAMVRGLVSWQFARITPYRSPYFQLSGPKYTARTEGRPRSFSAAQGQKQWQAVTVSEQGILSEWTFQGESLHTSMLSGFKDSPDHINSYCINYKSDGSVAYFASANDSSLWLLRDKKALKWTRLGNLVSALGSHLYAADMLQLYMIDLRHGGVVFHLSEDPNNSAWVAQEISTRAGPPAEYEKLTACNSILMDATFFDDEKLPIVNAAVHIVSDQLARLTVGERTVWVGLDLPPASCEADFLGKLSISCQVTSLTMPRLTITGTIPSTSISATVSCQADVVEGARGPVNLSSIANRLAGNDASFPVTKESLAQAGVIPPEFADIGDADHLVENIKAIGKWMAAQATAAENGSCVHRIEPKCWEMSFVDGSFRCKEADWRSISVQASERPGPFGFIDDAFNYVKHAAQSVTKIAINVVGDTIGVVIDGVISVTVRGFREAANLVETVLAWVWQSAKLVYEIAKAILDWLMMLFEWRDIVRTAKVLKYILQLPRENVDTMFERAKPFIEKNMELAVSRFEDMPATWRILQDMVARSPFQTANAYVNSLGSNPLGGSGNTLQASRVVDFAASNASRLNYVFSKVSGARIGASGLLDGSATGEMDHLYETLVGFAKKYLATAANVVVLDDLSSKIVSDKFQIGSLLDGSLAALMEMVSGICRLVWDIAKLSLDMLFDFIKKVIKEIWAALNRPLRIPIISEIFRELTGLETSLGDILCLALACPATIMFKLIKGRAPFDSALADYVTSEKFFGYLFGGKPDANAAADSKTVAETGDWKAAGEALGIIAGVLIQPAGALSMLFDAFCIAKVLTGDEAPSPKEVMWTALVTALGAFLVGCLEIPVQSIVKINHGEDEAVDRMTLLAWVVCTALLLPDIICPFSKKAFLLRDVPKWGPFSDSVAGIAMVILQVAVDITAGLEKDTNGFLYVNGLFQSLPRSCRALIYLAKSENPYIVPFSLVLLGVDGVCTYGSMATQIGYTAVAYK